MQFKKRKMDEAALAIPRLSKPEKLELDPDTAKAVVS
jgi:hypothetical protein